MATNDERPEAMLAFREHDPRVIPRLAIYRRSCCRCGSACALTPASASAADDLQIPIVCLDCLTPAEHDEMNAYVTTAQLVEFARYTAGQMG